MSRVNATSSVFDCARAQFFRATQMSQASASDVESNNVIVLQANENYASQEIIYSRLLNREMLKYIYIYI